MAKLLPNTVAQYAPINFDGILKDITTSLSLKNLSNIWRSLEMALINCKVKLKLKRTRCCVLAAAGNDNTDVNPNHFIFYQRHKTICFCRHFISRRQSKEDYQNFLAKDLKDQYWNEYKTKSENKNTTHQYRYFLESTYVAVNCFFILFYSNQDDSAKRFKA